VNRDDLLPLFPVGVVAAETGVSPETLRVWERRYGLPRPARSAGGRRLYSRRDIALVRWLAARQAEGVSIGEAVRLWRTLVAAGRDPLRPPAPEPGTLPGDGLYRRLTAEWVEACLAFDEARADAILSEAFALFDPETVCLRVLGRALAQLGEGWYLGRVSVQQEHFASALAQRRLEGLLAAQPPPSRPLTVLVGCPPGELHVVPALIGALMLRRRGYRVVYLGADVAPQRLEEALGAVRPQQAFMTAQRLVSAAALAEVAGLVCARGVGFVYGGLYFAQAPTARRLVPGRYLGSDPGALAEVLEAAGPEASVPELPPEYRQALELFRSARPCIRVRLWAAVPEGPEEVLGPAAVEMERMVEAALRLGDASLVGLELDWVFGLVVNHGRDPALLGAFLEAYARALEAAVSDPVLSGLADLIRSKAHGGGWG